MESFYELTKSEKEEARHLEMMIDPDEAQSIIAKVMYEAAKKRLEMLYERAVKRKLGSY